MNRIGLYVNLFCALFLFTYCVDRNGRGKVGVDDAGMTTVVVNKGNEYFANECIKQVEFVKLDLTENSLIGDAWKVRVTDDYIVVVDMLSSQAVFVFDRNGMPVATIKRSGRGPQEYIHMTHATLTPDQKQVVIYDNYGDKVLYYDFEGNFIKSTPVGFKFFSMEYVDDNTILCATYGVQAMNSDVSAFKDNDLLIYTDSDFNIKSGVLPSIYNRERFTHVMPDLIQFQHTVYVNPAYCDTIYVAGRDVLTACYRLDLDGIDGASNFASDMTDQKLEMLEESKALFSGSYVDGEDFLLFNVSLPPDQRLGTFLYAKGTQHVYQMKHDLEKPDYVIGLGLDYCSTCYKDQFVAAIPAYQIVMSLSEEVRSGIPALKDLTEESNPVIAFYTLKEPDTK